MRFNLSNFAKKVKVNGSVAFRNKSNAEKFKRLIRKRGLGTRILRTSGPVVEGGYTEHSYNVIVESKKFIKKKQNKLSYLESFANQRFW